MSKIRKWKVETRVVSRCIYFVSAGDERAAEAKTCECSSDHSEDESEETISITEITDMGSGKK